MAKAKSEKDTGGKGNTASKAATKSPAKSAAKSPVKGAAPVAKKAPVKGAAAGSAAKTSKSSTAKSVPKAVGKPAAKTASKAPAKPAGKKAPKPEAAKPAAPPPQDSAPAAGKSISLLKTLDPKQLQDHLPHIEVKILGEIIEKLEEMRRESSDIVNNHMRKDLERREDSNDVGDDLDQASNERDREFNLIMHQRHLRRLQQINDAFERIEEGSYGLCEGTDEPINPRRLLIMPLARYSLEYQEQQEKMLGRMVDGADMVGGTEEFSAED